MTSKPKEDSKNIKIIQAMKRFFFMFGSPSDPPTLSNFMSFDTQIVNKICSKTTYKGNISCSDIPLIKCLMTQPSNP